MVLGSIWEGLGEALGGIWGLLGPLGLFWGIFLSCLSLEWSSKVFLKASGLDFCSILKGLRRISGGFEEVSGRVWKGFWSILAAFGLL